MGKIVIDTGLYVDISSKRQPIYCTEKNRLILEKLLKDKIPLPAVDFKGELDFDVNAFISGKNPLKTIKKGDSTSAATAKSLKVKITIEW